MLRSVLLFSCLAAPLSGCIGDLVELTPKDQGTNNNPDLSMGGGGGDGGGGGNPVFNPDIFNDIVSLGCTSGGCHGGTTPPVLKNMTDPTTMMANYTNFTADANMGAGSLVLTKNLAGNGVSHGGGKAFPSTSDPVYMRWLAWINAGNPQ